MAVFRCDVLTPLRTVRLSDWRRSFIRARSDAAIASREALEIREAQSLTEQVLLQDLASVTLDSGKRKRTHFLQMMISERLRTVQRPCMHELALTCHRSSVVQSVRNSCSSIMIARKEGILTCHRSASVIGHTE